MFQSLQHRILSLFFRAGLVSATVLTACQFEPPAAMPEQKSSQGNVTVELKLRSVALAKGAAVARGGTRRPVLPGCYSRIGAYGSLKPSACSVSVSIASISSASPSSSCS